MRIYSNAFNFDSYLNGGVDTRTGQYGASITLATISPEGPGEGSRDIRLSFSMMEERNTGYGLGWTLSTSEFDETTRQLRLIGGQIYTTEILPPAGANAQVRMLDRKLNDIVVRRPNADTLHVIYKDGVVEVLSRLRAGPIFSLARLIFENGERFDFSYTWQGNADRLSLIRNVESQRDRLIVRYNNNVVESADVLQDRGRFSRLHFTLSNVQLLSVSVPVELNAGTNNRPAFVFQYQTINSYLAISSLRNPMGGEDQIQYNASGHLFHNNQRIPFVSRLTTRSGSGTPEVVHQYSYSQNNFTGFPFTLFQPGQDNMYQHTFPYDYWCRDQVIGTNSVVLQEKVTTFNRFHLLSSDVTARREKRFGVHYVYNDIVGALFGNQPPNLHLPKEETTRLEDGVRNRSETERTETDGFGNELVWIEASGVRHEFSYYPIAGIVGRCPPEPQGLFQRFVSQERMLPSSGGDNARVTEHTYKAIAGFAGGLPRVVRDSSVFANQLRHYFHYINAPLRVVEHGRLSETQMEMNNHTTRTTFGYQLDEDEFIERRYVSGAGNATLVSSHSTSVVNHLVLSVVKNETVRVNLAYDINGRVVTETSSPNTVNQAVRRYVYQFSNDANAANVVTTDALGGQYITRFDGMSRIISVAQIRPTGEQQLRSKTYDQLGQLVTDVTIDRINGVATSLTTRYHYNLWGQVTQTTRPDNSTVFTDYDPIDRVRLEGVSGAGYVRSYENGFDKVVRIQQVGTDNQTIELISRSFDGFGRCTSETDVNSNRTAFVYDGFDRITTETLTPADGSMQITTRNTYASHLVESLKTSVSINNVVLGEQTFDVVGRIVAQKRGNNPPTTFTYQQGATRPNIIKLPTGVEQEIQYDTQLDEISQIRIGNQPISVFGVNPVTGAQTSAVNGESTRTMQYDEYGWLRVDVQTINGQNFIHTYIHSPAGRLMQLDSGLGDVERRSYDLSGRIYAARISGGPTGVTEATVSYDAAGRISTTSVMAENRTFAATVAYDVFGREESRRITQNGNLFQTIFLTYFRNNKIASRRITDANQINVLHETFSYDTLGRLTSYVCNGPQYPVDQHGRSIQSQAFAYDALNNITQVITGLVGQGSDVAIREHRGADPTQLTQVTTTNPPQVVQLRYDAAGHLESEGIKAYSFDSLERLVAVHSDGRPVSSYGYDALGVQVRQSDASANSVGLHYSENRIVGVSQGSNRARYVRFEQNVLARSINAMGTEINVNDTAASVRTMVAANGGAKRVQYAPYGMSDIDGAGAGTLLERNRPAFNGERYDPVARLYHLGNGLRAYSPELMIFLSPDPLSPFGEGGINSYIYSGGDPVNFSDPSGLSFQSTSNIILAIVNLVILAASFAAVMSGFGAVAGAMGAAKVVAKVRLASNVISTGLAVASGVGQLVSAPMEEVSGVAIGLTVGAAAVGLLSMGMAFRPDLAATALRRMRALPMRDVRAGEMDLITSNRRSSLIRPESPNHTRPRTPPPAYTEAVGMPPGYTEGSFSFLPIVRPMSFASHPFSPSLSVSSLRSLPPSYTSTISNSVSSEALSFNWSGSARRSSELFMPTSGDVHGMIGSVDDFGEAFARQSRNIRMPYERRV